MCGLPFCQIWGTGLCLFEYVGKSRQRAKIVPGLLGVAANLVGQGLHGGKLLLRTEVAVKFHADLMAVQIAIKVQIKALHRHSVIVVLDGGSHAHVGHRAAALAVKPNPGGVDAKGGNNYTLGYL